jgi:hypothetical protein
MCKECGCGLTNPKDPGYGKGPKKGAKAAPAKKKAPAKKR